MDDQDTELENNYLRLENNQLRRGLRALHELPDSATIDEYGDWLVDAMGLDPDDRGEAVHTLRATLRAALNDGKD